MMRLNVQTAVCKQFSQMTPGRVGWFYSRYMKSQMKYDHHVHFFFLFSSCSFAVLVTSGCAVYEL